MVRVNSMSKPKTQLIHMKTRSTKRTITLEELIHDINVRIQKQHQTLVTDHKSPTGYVLVLEGDQEVPTSYQHLAEMAFALDVPLPDIPARKPKG